MLQISLHEFARSGSLGSVTAGTPRSDVLSVLGQPTDSGLPPAPIDTVDIWKYGDIEIHFFDHAVWMIFTDWFDVPRGGNSFELDPWILRAGLCPDEFQTALSASGISFTLRQNRHNMDETDIITDGGVYFTFRKKDDESGRKGLCAFHTDPADA